jgi:hypothetical protein
MFGGPIKESKFPMIEGLHPESDTSQMLSDEMATQYHAIIGSLNWVVLLGRFDVMYATKTLARFFNDSSTWSSGGYQKDSWILKKHSEHRILLNPNPIDLSTATENCSEYNG